MLTTKRTKTTRRNGKPSPAATIRQLRARIKELERQVDRWQTALIRRLPPPPKRLRMTRKEMKEMEEYRPTFSEFVDQLKAELKAGS